mmetsp:Transcript_12669/g.12268  ORF Transcript_12669/g.12268 Transcript_12669/m.12268 type:complete len:316 (+) Transcript_12669:477-1424(+)
MRVMDTSHETTESMTLSSSPVALDETSMDNDKAISYITCHVSQHIQQLNWTTDVQLEAKDPCLESQLTAWEDQYNIQLPQDLREFYSVTSGMKLTWHAFFATTPPTDNKNNNNNYFNLGETQSPIPKEIIEDMQYDEKTKPRWYHNKKQLVGTVSISSLKHLKRTPPEETTGLDQYAIIPEQSKGMTKEIFAFVLENTEKCGVVYLVYGLLDFEKATNDAMSEKYHTSMDIASLDEDEEQNRLWSVWLKHTSENSKWYFLTSNFSSYFRLAIVHLGIIGWQNTFTVEGLDDYTMLCMRRFAPERLVVDLFHSREE